MIVAKMATFPPRHEHLQKSIDSLLPQVDLLTVYCNETVPLSITSNPKIKVMTGEDLGDGGKLEGVMGDYTFLVDDDIVYPSNYVKSMTNFMKSNDNKVIVGCHAATMHNPVTNYFSDRKVLHFQSRLSNNFPCNVLGTGTLAFHIDYLDLSTVTPSHKNMLDVYFAVACQEQQKRMVSIKRSSGWLKTLPCPGSLWENRGTGEVQTKVIQQVKTWKLY